MHVRAGVPIKNLHRVGVFHNKASRDPLQPKEYESRYGYVNPIDELITQLSDAGVGLIFADNNSIL